MKTDGTEVTWVQSKDNGEEIEGLLDMSVLIPELPLDGES